MLCIVHVCLASKGKQDTFYRLPLNISGLIPSETDLCDSRVPYLITFIPAFKWTFGWTETLLH